MNLLVDPLFTVERPDGSQGGLSLPGLLRALGAGEPVELAQLRPHQEQPVLAFLVQLGALVLSRGGGDVERSEEGWRRGLLDLSGGSGEAWELEVEDPRLPAFMQPPMGASLAAKMRSAPPLEFAPDAAMFEVLVTTRAFDVQPGRLRGAGAEHWAFSLVTLQTSQGYSGRGHYGAARLAGPFASRSFVGRTPSDRLAPRFRRDVEVWLRSRAAIVAAHGYREAGGHALLWTVPWDGGKDEGLPLGLLDPFFVDVCKVPRLRTEGGRLGFTYVTTLGSRVATECASGSESGTGDVWGWVREVKGERRLHSVGRGGWGYRDLAALLLGKERPPALAEHDYDGPTSHLYAHALVRAKGKTFGLRRRSVPLPHAVSTRLADHAARARLGARAEKFIALADEARGPVVQFALRALHGGGKPAGASARDARVARWVGAFEARVDREFFGALWGSVELDDDAAQAAWSGALVRLGRETVEEAMESTALPCARRHLVRGATRNCFEGSARRRLPGAFPKETET